MNAERLAEIRERAKQINPMQAEWVTLGKDEVHELLDYIAQLEVQRGEPDLYVYHHSPLTYDVFEDRETAESIAKTGLGELIPVWKAPQRGGAVVVAEIPRRITHCAAVTKGELWDAYVIIDKMLRAAPASQVLQPGMVGVDRREIEALRHIETQAKGFLAARDSSELIALVDAAKHSFDKLDALRSQAGGKG